MRRFTVGLAKKVLIANNVGFIWSKISAGQAGEPSVLLYWIGIIAYTFQIYFDFSGYSDMAIGLARIFGLTFDENFNYPYISRSITEFWRRWHITLSGWFRDYVYIRLAETVFKTETYTQSAYCLGADGILARRIVEFYFLGLYLR